MIAKFANGIRPVLALVALIWAVELVNLLLGHRLVSWGILPRTLRGLIGIPLSPWIHAGLWHAVSNTIPILILGGLTLAGGKRKFWETTISVILLSGILVWIFARGAFHVGASGLVFGYFGVILGRAVFERSAIAIAIAIGTVLAYGGLLWGILPLRSQVSFESHLFGLIAGFAVIWLGHKFRKSPPPS
ncbi:MAG: rhomboid family intramembrane serine protease [Proteobacteria bacterium]|nr:rhomboid family intramembrane serine protease [Pseudomonadota bacterium]